MSWIKRALDEGARFFTDFRPKIESTDANRDEPGATPTPEPLTEADEVNTFYFLSVFALLGKLAAADGEVEKEEVEHIQGFMLRQFEFNTQARELAIRVFDAAIDSDRTVADHANQIYDQFRKTPGLLSDVVDILVRVAGIDGDLHPREAEMIDDVVSIFRLDPADYAAIKAQHLDDVVSPAQRPYVILGVKPTATNYEVQKAYESAARRLSPDRLVEDGMPPELRKHAETHLAEIRAAYEQVRNERGNR